jgi:hypothetical protein
MGQKYATKDEISEKIHTYMQRERVKPDTFKWMAKKVEISENISVPFQDSKRRKEAIVTVLHTGLAHVHGVVVQGATSAVLVLAMRRPDASDDDPAHQHGRAARLE